MGALAQKKLSISKEHKEVLEHCEEWGFADQSSFVREALDLLIKELKRRKRKEQMECKARELLSEYAKEKELTAFTALDAEDFL